MANTQTGVGVGVGISTCKTGGAPATPQPSTFRLLRNTMGDFLQIETGSTDVLLWR